MKRFFASIAAMLLLLLGPVALAGERDLADELTEKSGADALLDALPRETGELLSDAGAEGPVLNGGEGKNVGEVLLRLLREGLSAPLTALTGILAAAAVTRLGSAFGSEGLRGAASLAGSVACAALTLSPVLDLMRTAQQTVERAGAFLVAAVPVYGGLLVVSGNAASGGSYSFLTLLAGNAVPLLTQTLIFPLIRGLLALALLGSVSDLSLGKLSATVYGAAKWFLVVAVSAFSGVLSVQASLNARVDAAGAKAAKLFASAAIPVVGSALGDAATAVKNSVDLVRSGVGAFGILAVLLLMAPAVIEAFLWVAVCAAGQIAAELFEAPGLGGMLAACGNAVRLILAALISVGVVALVSAAILLFAGGAA